MTLKLSPNITLICIEVIRGRVVKRAAIRLRRMWIAGRSSQQYPWLFEIVGWSQ
jgi:hypothetical protein